MFPTLRGRPGAGRGLAIVAVALALGGAALWAGGDGSSPATTRLEATGAAVVPSPPDARPSTAEAGDPQSLAVAEPAVPPATVPASSGAGGTIERVAAADAAVTTAPPPPAPAPAVTRPDAPPTTASSTSSTSTSTTSTTVPTGPAPGPAGATADVVRLTNRDRAGQGLGALSRNSCLDAVASGYAQKMAGTGVLAHNPGAGPAVIGCRPGATWGDNVGTSEPCDPALLEEKWMASPSHRANILTGAFQLVGVGAWTDEQGGCWLQVLFST